MVQDDFPGIIGEEREWYLLQRLKSAPCCLLEIQTTAPQKQLAVTSALEPLVVVISPGVVQIFHSVIKRMTN
jgi:hypothetical protein